MAILRNWIKEKIWKKKQVNKNEQDEIKIPYLARIKKGDKT